MKIFVTSFALLATLGAAQAEPVTYNVDPEHTNREGIASLPLRDKDDCIKDLAM